MKFTFSGSANSEAGSEVRARLLGSRITDEGRGKDGSDDDLSPGHGTLF